MQYEKAVQALCDAGVDFVVTGDVCAVFHGSTMVTYGLDVCYCRTSSNLQRLSTALAPFHPRPRGFPDSLPFLWDEGTLRNGTVFTLRTDIGEIDLLAEVAGLGAYDDVRARSIMVEAFDRRIATLDLRGLIQAKRAAGRGKDLSALPELESLLDSGVP